MNKTERQQLTVDKWKHSSDYGLEQNGSGTLVAVTGFGKTYSAIHDYVIPFLTKRFAAEVIILLAREEHQNAWNKSLDDNIKNSSIRKRVSVLTVQWLIKQGISVKTDFLIVDELHKFYGEEFSKYIDGTKIEFKYNLGLTATFKDPRGRHTKFLKYWKPFDVITQEEALQNGWISQFIEYNFGIELSKEEAKNHNFYMEELNKYLPKFGKHGIRGAELCYRGGVGKTNKRFATSKEWCARYADSMGWTPILEKDHEINLLWNPNLIYGYAKKAITNYRKLNDLLYYSESKFQVAMQVLEYFKGKKTMTFGQSSAFADRLVEEYNERGYGNAVCFHTQLKPVEMYDIHGEVIRYKSGAKAGEIKLFGVDAQKSLALTNFVTGKANALMSVSALDENFDCPDIELGLITGRTNNPNQQLQRGGRIKRLIPKNKDSIAIIINLYYKNTKDYDWLRNAQANNEHHTKWITTVEEIDLIIPLGEDVFDITDI